LQNRQTNEPFIGLDFFLLFVLWTPFVLVFFFDCIIWYFVFQAIVGYIVGMQNRLGEIRTFTTLSRMFTEAPWQFIKKFVITRSADRSIPTTGSIQSDHSQSPRSEEVKNVGLRRAVSDTGAHSANPFHTESWQKFAIAWNKVSLVERIIQICKHPKSHQSTC